ncbi:diamine acetyltransferase 1 [Chelonus insularis]|uniref:diamine acetyltransferase 1 n=1 Tax=Chelonus insularis TaxID=460826 RepID=UPI00158BFEC7|nr:diamine acetyltransferase 1 [Chelonus insularis]
MEDIKIRELRREDCVSLRKLMQELADFQEMPDAIELNSEDLQKYAFGENPRFYAFVAEFNGDLVGHAIYYDTFSSWRGKCMFLDELYVKSEFRNKGIGSLLYDAVKKRAKSEGCARLQFLTLKSNPAKEFYKRRGAVNVTEKIQWELYEVDKNNL